jgi:hypothetical protein
MLGDSVCPSVDTGEQSRYIPNDLVVGNLLSAIAFQSYLVDTAERKMMPQHNLHRDDLRSGLARFDSYGRTAAYPDITVPPLLARKRRLLNAVVARGWVYR